MDIINFLFQTVRSSMAFLFGSTGEILTEKSGHLNLGIPGTMCVGAAFGCCAESIYVTSVGGIDAANPFLAVLLPILATFIGGGLMGLIYCFLAVTLRANQNVTGLVLTTLGIGISDFMISLVEASSFSTASKFFTAYLPFADKLGAFGKLIFSYGAMVYLSIVVALICAFVLKKTRTGLHLRAVGEDPATADAAGISVTKYRYIATILGSGIAGLGGLGYIMDNLGGNWEYTIDAIGWLAIALVIFSLWKPNLAILGSFVFGAFYKIGNYIPGISTTQKPLIKMIPYVVTIIVLIVTSIRNKKENQAPEGLGLSYFREER